VSVAGCGVSVGTVELVAVGVLGGVGEGELGVGVRDAEGEGEIVFVGVIDTLGDGEVVVVSSISLGSGVGDRGGILVSIVGWILLSIGEDP
jgi:hypothetical protein